MSCHSVKLETCLTVSAFTKNSMIQDRFHRNRIKAKSSPMWSCISWLVYLAAILAVHLSVQNCGVFV